MFWHALKDKDEDVLFLYDDFQLDSTFIGRLDDADFRQPKKQCLLVRKMRISSFEFERVRLTLLEQINKL